MQLSFAFTIRARPEVVRGNIRLQFPRWVYQYERAQLLAPRIRRDSRGRFY